MPRGGVFFFTSKSAIIILEIVVGFSMLKVIEKVMFWIQRSGRLLHSSWVVVSYGQKYPQFDVKYSTTKSQDMLVLLR